MSRIFQEFGFLAPGWKDLLEILVVTAIFYRVLTLLASTRALQILLGFVLLAGVYFIASVLGLDLLSTLLQTVFQIGAIAALIIFQPELRNALAHLGQNRLLRLFNRLEEREVVGELVVAAEALARAKVGAIIALEQEVGLGEYIETGVPQQARVSAPLLVSIFTPLTPLHDGAVIVRSDTIIAAGAILPLTQFPVVDKSLGTRHRAAIGLSEETDAMVIVVSEETGQISVAHRGQLHRNVERGQLENFLGEPQPQQRFSFARA